MNVPQQADGAEIAAPMAHGRIRSTHFLGTPVVRLHGDRALVETRVILLAELVGRAVDATVHSRFRRDGRDEIGWRIVRREPGYDFGGFTYPSGSAAAPDFDGAAPAERHPTEYAAPAG